MAETEELVFTDNKSSAVNSVTQEIHEAREQLTETATQIQRRVRSNLNWRHIIQHQPLTVLTVALGIGALVGFASAPKSIATSSGASKATPKVDVWTPTLAMIVTSVVREGAKYLFDERLRDSKK